MYAVNHVSQKANCKISNYCVSRKQQFSSRGQITSKVSSEKNTLNTQLTLMTSNSTRIKPMDIYKQEVEKKLASRIRKTSQRTKAMRSALRLCSHSRVLNIYLTDKKSWIGFQVHIAWRLLLFEWCKMPFELFCTKVSTQSITRAVWMNANFLKSCQLLTVS